MTSSLRELAPGQLWVADMVAQKVGFRYDARMTALRLPDGGLWLHSPIALTAALRGELDALGPVRCLVAPSRMHYLHLPEFASAYPEARVYLAPGLKKPGGLRADAVLSASPEPEWAEVMEQSLFLGSSLYDEADFFHRPTRTLILTDLLFNIPEERSWSTRLIARMLGVLGRPAVSRSFPLSIRDRTAVRLSLERILAWDFDRVILSHGNLVETGGKEAFRQAFASVLKK